jgi:glyoxylase-like metal-dependent hydrolase (beta-lactamase superfamily II)
MGFVQCYLVQGDGLIMIDAGMPGQAGTFAKATAALGIQPRDIRLMVITHGHFDHTGSAKAIKDLTRAKIAMHRQDKDCLEVPLRRPPRGATPWGRVLVGALGVVASSPQIAPTQVDVVLGDEGCSLVEYGIPGRVIYTPGHTMGSVSVLLETGEALVGDLAMNALPLRLGPGLPALAEDIQKVRESWRLLLDAGAKTVYPAHGKPFSAEVMRRALGAA